MKLRSHTIIPSELYVRRRADDQLQQIIDDMGRPGYVLVARQMGKTNLLLNAKRSAHVGDLFVYVDVSNIFPDERSFFRSVIDLAIETSQSNGVFVMEVIERERKESQLLPHKEHERELRRLLQSTEGKVVICLDEIDALTKTGYSDSVFSFIRSIYFSGRANFPEFARLTYVLSGVAEPGDLIKNKAVSPFNIGEKIYLEDFSLDEVKSFLDLAQINFENEIVEAIYEWTSGHPRMMWDLVTKLQQEGITTAVDVEGVVKRLYFASVDVPPVDHIKTLVESSRDIRDALISIHYKKSDAIPDATRTRLYLFGISEFDPNTRKVTFKNRILELALSEQFLLNLDKVQPTYESAIRSYHAEHMDDALAGFLGFIKAMPEDARVPLARFWCGVCCYSMAKYTEALAYLNRLDDLELPVTTVVARKFFLGMSLLRTGKPAEAISYLRQAVTNNVITDFPHAHIQAGVALGDAVTRIGMSSDEQLFVDAIALCQHVVDQPELVRSSMRDPIVFAALQVDAYVALAKAASIRTTREHAFELLDKARVHADAAARLRLVMLEISLARDAAESKILLGKAIAESLTVRHFEHSRDDDTPLTNVLVLARKLHKAGQNDSVLTVVNHLLDHLAASADVAAVIDEFIIDLYNDGASALAKDIVGIALKIQTSRAQPKNKVLLAYAIISDEFDADRFADPYFSCFDSPDAIDIDDLRFIVAVIQAAINHGNEQAAQKGVVLMQHALQLHLQSKEPRYIAASRNVELLTEFCSILFGLKFAPNSVTTGKAGDLLKQFSRIANFELTYFPRNYAKVMAGEIASHVRRLSVITPIRRTGKKYGRNDLVNVSYGGEVRSGKYKNFENDIRGGLCFIVE